MANTIRVKRRAAGGAVGAPASLENAELAYNEQDDTLYYGKGTGGAGGTATTVIPIGGPGAFTPITHVGSGGTAHADAVANGASGFMSGTDKTKLNGVAAGATNYAHPANHPPSIITQDASNRFVTDAEKTAWNAKQAGDADLTAIAALAGTSGLLKKTAADTWVLDTAAYSTTVGTVTGVTATAPVASSGGTAPVISMAAATSAVNGYMTSTYAGKLDNIAANANAYSHPNHSGDVTSTGDGVTVIGANKVTNTQLAQVATGVIKGRLTAATGNVEDLTAAAVRTLINVANGANAYSHPTGDGNLHVPVTSTSNNGKVLTAGSSAGALSWVAPLALTSTAPAALGASAVGVATDAARRDHVHALPTLNALGLPVADVALNGKKITGLADPVSAQDAATKNYVDSVAQGLDAKASAVVATTANITLSALQTIDGIAVVAGNRVLVKDQTLPEQNGIYTVNAGAWTRGVGCNTWDEMISAFVFVENGTTNANNGYLCTVLAGGTLGTTAVSFVQFSGAGQVISGAGLTKSGNTLNVATASSARIVVNSDSIDLAVTPVTAGTYRSVTADTYGRITAGTNPTTLSGYGISDALSTSASIDGGTY